MNKVKIVFEWSVDDVLSLDSSLTKDQAIEILEDFQGKCEDSNLISEAFWFHLDDVIAQYKVVENEII